MFTAETKAKKMKSESLEEEQVPVPVVQPPSSRRPPKASLERAIEIKEELLAQIEQLGANLPPNTLDHLIDELGGPDNVAEMTGRVGRVVHNDNGQVRKSTKYIVISMLFIAIILFSGTIRVTF